VAKHFNELQNYTEKRRCIKISADRGNIMYSNCTLHSTRLTFPAANTMHPSSNGPSPLLGIYWSTKSIFAVWQKALVFLS